jgi:hypothetical protein
MATKPLPTGTPVSARQAATGTEGECERARHMLEFTARWESGFVPKMLFVTFQHPTTYYEASYAIDSTNLGQCGQWITNELIPYIK